MRTTVDPAGRHEHEAIGDEWVILELTDFPVEEEDGGRFSDETFLYPPEMKNSSNLLTLDICTELLPYLPSRARASPWRLIYSTLLDGYSLRNLYQKTQEVQSPALFVIKDVKDHVRNSGNHPPSSWTFVAFVFGFYRSIDQLIDWLICWWIDWLIDWSVNGLIDWLIVFLFLLRPFHSCTARCSDFLGLRSHYVVPAKKSGEVLWQWGELRILLQSKLNGNVQFQCEIHRTIWNYASKRN